MWLIINEVYVMLMILVILVYGSIYNSINWSLVSLVLCVGGVLSLISYGNSDINLVSESYVNDSLINSFNVLVYIISGLCLVSSMNKLNNNLEYSWLLLVSVWSLGILLSSNNLLTFYISIEIQSLSFYVLVSYGRNSSYSTESGLKYFIVGSLSSGIMLFGLSIIYNEYGTLNYSSLNKLMYNNESLWSNIGIMMLLVSLYFNCSLSPFNMWYVDVVDGAIMRSSMLISLVPNVGIVGILIKLSLMIGDNEIVSWSLVIVGIMSILVSMIGGYYQRSINRFLAYSSIGNLGYLALSLSVLYSNEWVVNSITIYLIIYAITGLVMWSVIENNSWVYISDLSINTNKYILVTQLIVMLSMASVPPMIGFLANVKLLESMVGSGDVVIALFMLVCTIGISYNYLRWLNVLYNDSLVNSTIEVVNWGNVESLLISVILVIISLGVWIV